MARPFTVQQKLGILSWFLYWLLFCSWPLNDRVIQCSDFDPLLFCIHTYLDGIINWMDKSQQTSGDSEEQGSLECCSPWGCKESDTTEWLNNNTHLYGFIQLQDGWLQILYISSPGLSSVLQMFIFSYPLVDISIWMSSEFLKLVV